MSDDISLDDLAEQLDDDDSGGGGSDETPMPIGMAAQILAEALLGRNGIAGVMAEADKPNEGITILVLEGFMETATEGAPAQIYGYDLHFKSVTLDEIDKMSKLEEAQVYNGSPGKLTEVKAAKRSDEHGNSSREQLKAHMREAGYSENQICGTDTMADMICRLIFRRYESAHERNVLLATMIAATRLLDVCEEGKRLSGEHELAGAVQDELACLDTAKLDEIDACTNHDARVAGFLEAGLKYVALGDGKDKKMFQETAKVIMGIADTVGNESPPPQPEEPSPYQKLMEDPDTF